MLELEDEIFDGPSSVRAFHCFAEVCLGRGRRPWDISTLVKVLTWIPSCFKPPMESVEILPWNTQDQGNCEAIPTCRQDGRGKLNQVGPGTDPNTVGSVQNSVCHKAYGIGSIETAFTAQYRVDGLMDRSRC